MIGEVMLLRLFIAINFSEELKTKIETIIQGLKSHAQKGNFTKRENIHLTLVFIGETTKADDVKVCIEGLKVSPFTMTLGGLGYFPRDNGSIYWLGVEKNETLTSVHQQLTEALIKMGLDMERRPYKPHLTLGREVIINKSLKYRDFEKKIEPMSMEITSVSLMKSERINGKLIYTEIFHKEFIS